MANRNDYEWERMRDRDRGYDRGQDRDRWSDRDRNNEYDRQRQKRMQVEQRHCCVNRKLDPPGQWAFVVRRRADRAGRFRGISFNGPAGVTDGGYGSWPEKLFPPMPQQHQTCRNCVQPAALRNQHG